MLEQLMGAVAYGVGAALDPLTWVLAAVLAWCALPRWWLVAVVGSIPGPTMLTLGLQLTAVPTPRPSAEQWGGVVLVSVLVTLLLAAAIRALRRAHA